MAAQKESGQKMVGDKSMNMFQKEFIGILQAAFSKEKAVDISSDFDWEKAIAVAKEHNIAAILYYGAINCGVSQGEQYMQELHGLTLRAAMVSMRQMHEIEQIQKAFEEEQIEYLPLKGTILKEIYPKPEMRTMGDADILIKLEQYPAIAAIMERLHFTFRHETDHELIWQKPTLFLELHKRIMTTYNEDFYRYFGTGWSIANKTETSRYEMSTESFYLFAFVHFAKHYRISGIGIKHLIDLWVYADAHPELDWTYVEEELQKMRLSKFHRNIRKTINVWFAGGADTEITDLITNVIFNSGQYGSAEMAIVNRALQNGKKSATKVKADRITKSVFLPLEAMQKKYPILEKLPILLPIMWIVRCFDILFHQTARLKRYLRTTKQIDTAQMKENEQVLYVVGLDFGTGE